MRFIGFLMLLVISTDTFSAEYLCGDLRRIRAWANGSDTYGVWVEYEKNPAVCSGGFYLQHQAQNKQLVFSMLLAAKHAKTPICIQVYSHDTDIGSRCRINYVAHQ